MFGLVRYRAPGAPTPPLLRLGGAAFRCVYLREGRGLAASLTAAHAARVLEREGVREALFPADGLWLRSFARHGVAPLSPCPLYRETAAALARRALEQLRVPPRTATVCLAALRVTEPMERAAEALSDTVRHLILSAPDGAALSRRLLLRRGVAVRPAPAEGPIRCDLLLRFDAAPVSCAAPTLPLGDPCWSPVYDAPPVPGAEGMPRNALLCALWRCGCLDAASLSVRDAVLC